MQSSTLENALVAIINQVTTGIDTSVTFLSTQIPDIIQQLLLWKLIDKLMWTSVELSAMTFCIIVSIKLYYKGKTYIPKNPYDTDQSDIYCMSLGIFILGLFFLIVTLLDLTVILQIWLAPKVYLIEYAHGLLK